MSAAVAEEVQRRTADPPVGGKRRPRILFLIDEMSAITAGGTERQLLQMVGIARRNGLDPTVCVLRGTKWLTEDVAQCPVAHFEIQSIRTGAGLRSLYKLARWMRAQKFAILMTFFSESNLVAPWVGRVAGIPIILGTRRNLTHWVDEAPMRAVLRTQWLSNLLVNEILVNSQAVLRNTAQNEWLSRGKLRVIYNGIEFDKLTPDPASREMMRRKLGVGDGEVLVGNVSGLRAVKGVIQFVESAAMVRAIDPSVKFVLVGDGELRDEVEATVKRHGLDDVFHVAGAATDVRPYLAAMDIAVLCSTAEGMSNSLLEYMAAGLPVIATDVGGNREALGAAGILIPPQNPQALQNAILTLLDSGERQVMSEAARREVQKFDIQHAEKALGTVFESQLDRARGWRRPDISRIHTTRRLTKGDSSLPGTAHEVVSIPDLVHHRQGTRKVSGEIRFQGRAVSHEEVARQAREIASAMAARGIGIGSTVAIFLERGIGLVEAILGVLQSGAAYVPLDPHDPRERAEYVLKQSGASLIITETRHRDLLGSGIPAICLDRDDWRDSRRPAPAVAPSPDSLAYVIFTSGSTGKPKGVEVTHGAVTNLLLSMEKLLGAGAKDTMLALTTFSFDIAGLELLLPLVTGCRMVIAGREDARDPRRLLQLVREQNVSILQATPVTWRALLDAGFTSHRGLKMLCGGEAWSRELADRLLAGDGRLWNVYGPTETTIWSSAGEVLNDGRPVTLGQPLANTWLYLLDEAGQPIQGNDEAGELYIGGEGVARGYRNQPKLTEEKFLADPFRPGGRMFRTGDLVRRTADGELQYVGRADNQIKLRGYRIELEEIEHAIRNTGLAENCVVALKNDPRDQPLLVAYLENPRVDSHEMRLRLFRTLPGYMVPAVFTTVAALPQTPNRKVDRKSLPEPDWAVLTQLRDDVETGPQAETATVSSDTEVMVTLWRSIFPTLDVRPDSNFFDLGGQSIDFAELQTLVFTETGLDVTAEDILAAPTPATLTGRIKYAQRSVLERQVIPIRSEGDKPPLYLISQSLVFREVAEQLGPRQPVFAIRMSEEDAEQMGPSPSFEAIASYYANTIRRLQPNGPYRLGGWCVAGWLAYEVARQLQDAYNSVQLLVVVDAWAPAYWRDMSPWRRALAKFTYNIARVRLHLSNLPRTHKLRFILDRLRGWFSGAPDNNLTEDSTAIDRMVDKASERYNPGTFRGNALVFRSAEQPSGKFLPVDMGWARLLEEPPSVTSLPGDHRKILSGGAAMRLASDITNTLQTM